MFVSVVCARLTTTCGFQTNLAAIRAKGTIVWLGFASGFVDPFVPYITGIKAVKYVFAS